VETSSLPLDAVEAFLAARHGGRATEVEVLRGGFWSAAFGYRVDDQALVVRFGDMREGFEMDRAAMAFDRPDLPVPEVIEIGEALDRTYAISVRHGGRFLETIRPDEAGRAGPAVERTLAALRAVPAPPDAGTEWYPGTDGAEGPSWRRWLLDGLVDDPGQRVSGWRAVLAGDDDLDRLFRACETRIGELLDACPERRDLVHGDLLNRNVLIADDLSRITAVFSWKCSVRGDFLFDIAWCTFWASWHPGIDALDLWARTLASPTLTDDALRDAALRHHCYELQIGATHLGWHAWTGDHDELRSVAVRTEAILTRGPRSEARAEAPS
jgi:aminoglycoside phosphotransferase (APT) family kinase protein